MSDSDRMFALDHLRANHPKELRRLQKSGQLQEYLDLAEKQAQETKSFLLANAEDNDLAARHRANEIARAQMSELPVGHEDSPIPDEFRAMRLAGLID